MTWEKPDVEYDLFIAHASEDKEFVRPLATRLRDLGLRVWYDEFELTIGDSLIGAIDRGLAHCRYGALIVSASFLGKAWPEYERRGLTAREIGSGKVVLPVWLNVSRDDILSFSPPLADKYAITTGGSEPDRVALELLAVVSPEIFEDLGRRAAFEERVRQVPVSKVKVADLSPGPIRHERLPKSLILRLAVIHEVFADVSSIPFEEMVDGFRRGLRPEREATIWEAMAVSYLRIAREENLDIDERKDLFGVVLAASWGDLPKDGERSVVSAERIREVQETLEAALNKYGY